MKLLLTFAVVVLLVACVASDKAPPKGQAQNQKGDQNPAKQVNVKPESGRNQQAEAGKRQSGRGDQSSEEEKPQSGRQPGGVPAKQSNGQDQGKKPNQDAKPANNKPENKNNRQ